MSDRTTERLTRVLGSIHPDDLNGFLARNREAMIMGENPFAAYMRERLREKGIRQQDAFVAADLSESYGYKLISGEKHTKQRDVILRLCLAGRFTLREAQRALRLYGFSPLYARVPRDAVLTVVFQEGVYEIAEANALLQEHGMELLHEYTSDE